MGSSRIRPAILGLAPLLYYRLDEVSDSAASGQEAQDQSGNAHNGEYVNFCTMGADGLALGDPDFGVSFLEEKGAYVRTNWGGAFAGTKTIWGLYKRRSAHEEHDAFFSNSQSGGNGIYAYIEKGTSHIRLTVNGFGTTAKWENAWPSDEVVHDVCFVIKPGTAKAILYIDGVSKGERAISAYGVTPGNLRIGHDNTTGAVKMTFAGTADEFAVFEGELSAEQIAALHTARSTAPAAPRTRSYWGADADGDVGIMEGGSARGDAPRDDVTWERFEEHAGRPMGIMHFADPFMVWDGYDAEGAVSSSQKCIDRAVIPMKTIGGGTGIVEAVLSGARDAEIDQWATEAMAFGYPVMIRLWWEMNGSWYPWGTTAISDAAYVAGWRYVHDRVSAIADNVTWIWCINQTSGLPDPGPRYPGDDYVDWVAVDGYSGQNPAKKYGWKSPVRLFQASVDRLAEIAPDKPVMVAETAASEFGGQKSKWITHLLAGDALQDVMTRVRAFVWFNWNIEEGTPAGSRMDWPIESSPAAQAAFAAAIASPYYSDPPATADSPFVRPHAPIMPITPIASIASGPASQDPAEEVAFVFTADLEGATFEYRLDGGEWQAAASPLQLRDLTEREHLLEVRAADEDGFTGPITAYEWRRPGTRVLQPGEVPKLRVPLQMVGGRLATVQQDSPDNVAACVYAVLSYERGARLEDPDFGVESRLFDQLPVDVDEWLEQIAAYEPRADVFTQQEIEESVGLVLVEVGFSR